MKPLVEVIPSPWFIKRAKKLHKRYPHVREKIQALIDKLIQGETPGDQL